MLGSTQELHRRTAQFATLRMKMMMCFLLLLLICSSSTAQPQTEPAHASNQQQSSALEIPVLLTGVIATLAEVKTEMRNLQRENEAQAAELIAINARSNVTKNQVEALRRDGEVKQVAFSASLFASSSGYVGPFGTHTPLVFKHVVTNIGNAYDPNTGFFTAPVRGGYHFEFHIGTFGHTTYATGAVLVKNEEHVFVAYENQPTGYGSSANGVTLLLEVGDVVSLRLWENTRMYDNENHHNTFSGNLLFTM